jgi:uncharacterized membrane protein
MPEETAQSGLSDNAAGAIAYITFIPAIVFLVLPPYNASSYVRFHAWQSILMTVAAVVIDIVLAIVLGIALVFLPFFLHTLLWSLIELAWLAIWVVCVVQALNGKRFKLPIIGDLAAKQAGN